MDAGVSATGQSVTGPPKHPTGDKSPIRSRWLAYDRFPEVPRSSAPQARQRGSWAVFCAAMPRLYRPNDYASPHRRPRPSLTLRKSCQIDATGRGRSICGAHFLPTQNPRTRCERECRAGPLALAAVGHAGVKPTRRCFVLVSASERCGVLTHHCALFEGLTRKKL